MGSMEEKVLRPKAECCSSFVVFVELCSAVRTSLSICRDFLSAFGAFEGLGRRIDGSISMFNDRFGILIEDCTAFGTELCVKRNLCSTFRTLEEILFMKDLDIFRYFDGGSAFPTDDLTGKNKGSAFFALVISFGIEPSVLNELVALLPCTPSHQF